MVSGRFTRASGGVTETFNYDEGTYGKGRLTSIVDASGQTSYTYTAAGELSTHNTVVSGQTFSTGWTYDAVGCMQTMTYPSGFKLTYAYDAYCCAPRFRRTICQSPHHKVVKISAGISRFGVVAFSARAGLWS